VIGCIGLLMQIPTLMQAQYLPRCMSLNEGEEVRYDVFFKWGFLMSRAGESKVSFRPSTFRGQKASTYQMTFQSSKFFDSVYKMRDTIDCYYASDYALLYSSKRICESNYYQTDEISFSYPEGNQTRIHTRQYTPGRVKVDTVLTVASGAVFDMLGVVFFLRTLDWKQLKHGDVFPSTVVSGRDLVKISYRYQDAVVMEKDHVKYRTHHFFIDIYDPAFAQNKAAAELWVGDDENHLPLKVRSKLKIGYAEVHYKDAGKLKAPLNCEVKEKSAPLNP